MNKIIFVVLCLFLGCTFTPTKIVREYHISIYVTEGSEVYFTPEILADVQKQKEVETKTETDARVDATTDFSGLY